MIEEEIDEIKRQLGHCKSIEKRLHESLTSDLEAIISKKVVSHQPEVTMVDLEQIEERLSKLYSQQSVLDVRLEEIYWLTTQTRKTFEEYCAEVQSSYQTLLKKQRVVEKKLTNTEVKKDDEWAHIAVPESSIQAETKKKKEQDITKSHYANLNLEIAKVEEFLEEIEQFREFFLAERPDLANIS